MNAPRIQGRQLLPSMLGSALGVHDFRRHVARGCPHETEGQDWLDAVLESGPGRAPNRWATGAMPTSLPTVHGANASAPSGDAADLWSRSGPRLAGLVVPLSAAPFAAGQPVAEYVSPGYGEPDETLIPDPRGSLTPAQMVDQKLLALLGSCARSRQQLRGQLGGWGPTWVRQAITPVGW